MNQTTNLQNKIVRNTIFNSVGYFFTLILSILLTPFIIHRLGMDRFSIWVLVSVLVSYFALLDFGIGTASVKYTAEYYAHKDYDKINQLIISAILFYALMGILLIPVIFFKDFILSFFKIKDSMLNEASFVFLTAVFTFIVSFIFGVFGNVLVGLQKIDVSKKIHIVFATINAAGTIVVLSLGLGLKGLVVNIAIVKVLTLITQFITLYNILPQLKLNLSCFNIKMIKKFFKYGIKLQITGLSGIMSFQMDKFLIGHFLNMSLVGFYELGSKIAGFIRQIPMLILPAILPAAAELDALKNKADLNKLYFRSSKYLAFLALPLAFFLTTLAPLIMFIWMGGTGYNKSILALRILGWGYFFNIITGVITSVARGIGVPQYEMKTSVFIAISNLLLSIILIVKIGFIGALIGTSFSLLAGNIYYIVTFHTRHIKGSIFEFIKKTYVKPIFACLLGVIIIFISQTMLFNKLINLNPTRINYSIFFIVQFFIFISIYLYLLIKTKFITQEDYKLLGQIKNSLIRRT